ncbi:hypothetical protein FHS14_001159 [Paenibacillus baekrokdamisoli]|nr:hypothetical protein [Paenibacillus baekrokdamisoli]
MKICMIDGCDKSTKAKGMCSMHHQRWRRHGDPCFIKVRQSGHPISCQWIKCERIAISKGYCAKHYYIQRNIGLEEKHSASID